MFKELLRELIREEINKALEEKKDPNSEMKEWEQSRANYEKANPRPQVERICMRYNCGRKMNIPKLQDNYTSERPLFCLTCWEALYHYLNLKENFHPEKTRKEHEKDLYAEFIKTKE